MKKSLLCNFLFEKQVFPTKKMGNLLKYKKTKRAELKTQFLHYTKESFEEKIGRSFLDDLLSNKYSFTGLFKKEINNSLFVQKTFSFLLEEIEQTSFSDYIQRAISTQEETQNVWQEVRLRRLITSEEA